MNKLETIVEFKRKEVEIRKVKMPMKELEKGPFYKKKGLSLRECLMDTHKTGIIAEFKRSSPSKGAINAHARVEHVTSAYAENGASGISVLTDAEFFGGSLYDLEIATVTKIPLLRKDFIIDEYQVYESKAYGADVILLIAACLSKDEVKTFATLAHQLGMEVLLEVHEQKELGHVVDQVDMVGVNNRDLKTFDIDINVSLQLINQIPPEKPAISESGINSVETIVTLKRAGYKGFLIGENFMKATDPAIAFAAFVQQLKAT